ncbi:AI-2E family transporter [Propioniciclava soli]|uniref:AI-2E family transporter n=1 Tax=Propioniciclava soli TaxID=2775081 RepID=A0ABZ3C5V8_9ACTN
MAERTHKVTPGIQGPSAMSTVVTMAGLVVLLVGMREFNDIVGPFFLTVSLFIAAYPIQPKLIEAGMPRVVASVVLGLLVFTILGAFFYMLTWAITSLIAELPSYQGQFWTMYRQTVDWLGSWGVSEAEVSRQLQQINPVNFAGLLQGLLREVTSVVTLLVVLVTMIFMMTIDSSTFGARNRALNAHQPRVWLSVMDYTLGVRRYWVVTSVFGLIVAVIDVIALMWLGVPLALVWGILSFLTNYIPNIGFVIGLVPPAIMALLANDPLTALLVVIIYSVANFVIQSIVQPKFNGDAVGVTATVALLSLLLWSSVLGALGALLALPMTLLAKALFVDHDPRLRWLNAFISNDPSTANPDVLAAVSEPGNVREADTGRAVSAVAAQDAHADDGRAGGAHPQGPRGGAPRGGGGSSAADPAREKPAPEASEAGSGPAGEPDQRL